MARDGSSFWQRMLLNGYPPREVRGSRKSRRKGGRLRLGALPPALTSWSPKIPDEPIEFLVLGFGDVSRSDEGVGLHVVRQLKRRVARGITCIDAGTGDLQVIGAMEVAERIALVDGMIDGRAPGTLTVLRPEGPNDYPLSLVAFDLGVCHMLDAFYQLGERIEVVLFGISIDSAQREGLGLSDAVWNAMPQITDRILFEARLSSAA